jgi:glycosyltransferase involved in cell wall biosynthesis
MACGCPVITSNTYACKEVAGEAALLVDPASTMEIREALDRLTEQPALRARLAAKGKERAASFTWRNAALETLAIFDSLEAAETGAVPTPSR